MGSSFLPRLVNGSFEDPLLFIPFRYENRALLFDLGDVYTLSPKEILKISHIFVSHTHMDHFAGFDRVLRILLGRDKDLHLYGPQGFLKNVEGKLSGYCWNLVKRYTNQFTLHVTELHPRHALSRRYRCNKGFRADGAPRKELFNGVALNEPALAVQAVHLDHGTPVLAFALRERFHVNIDKAALERIGIAPGPWLNQLKALIYDNADPDTLITIPQKEVPAAPLKLTVKELKASIVKLSSGQTLAYITDAEGSATNLHKMLALAKGVDHLYIEAAFLEDHSEIAKEKNHLTARKAGEIARLCGAKHFTIFHFSPRYSECPERLEAEADEAFRG